MAYTVSFSHRKSPGSCHHLGVRALLCVGALLVASALQAQVMRCQDPSTGALTYTDGACASGQSSRQVTPARTADEKAQEEARSHSARTRWEQEQARAESARKAEMESAQREQAAAHQATNGPGAHAAPSPVNPACQAAQQELQALVQTQPSHSPAVTAAQRTMELQCLSPATREALERNRASTAESNTTVVPIYMPRPPAAYPPPYGTAWPEPWPGHGTAPPPPPAPSKPAPPAPATRPHVPGKIQNVY